MTKYLNFYIENAQIEENKNNSEFLNAKIDAFSTGESRNNTFCDLESLQRTAPTIYEKPILFTIDKNFDDFYTHVSPSESMIAGFVVPNSAEIKEGDDGRHTLSVSAKIWSRYAERFVNVFKSSQSKSKKVSVEVALLDSEEGENGILKMKDWIFSGICVLSDFVTEASPGANMVLNFSKANDEYKMAYDMEFSSRYEGVDFKIPQSVKNNAKNGLELHKKYGRGGTSVGLASARYLISHDEISPEKARHVAKYFPRHNGDNLDDKTSNGWIAWLLWGGTTAWKWSQNIVDKLNERDAKNMAYFETLTFPYKSLKDINPALKGLSPKISVEQANAIAKQADAIGVDEEKNGWAIAISSFKKTHVVKDGRWVKKDEKEVMAMEDEKKFEEDVKEEEKEVEEEKKEVEEEKAEGEEKNMSLNANLDVKAMLAMLCGETKSYEDAAKEFSREDGSMDFVTMAYAMYEKMCKMSEEKKELEEKFAKSQEDCTTYMAENEELKKFKSDIESKQFEYEVAYTLKEVEGEMPKEEMYDLKEQAKNFTLENIDGWKNAVKAKAFSFAKKGKEEKSFAIGLPFSTNPNDKKPFSLWG